MIILAKTWKLWSQRNENKVWEIKNSVYEFKSRLHIAKDRDTRKALKKIPNVKQEEKKI